MKSFVLNVRDYADFPLVDLIASVTLREYAFALKFVFIARSVALLWPILLPPIVSYRRRLYGLMCAIAMDSGAQRSFFVWVKAWPRTINKFSPPKLRSRVKSFSFDVQSLNFESISFFSYHLHNLLVIVGLMTSYPLGHVCLSSAVLRNL